MNARLADRQIRAAALRAAPTLDVRGPVSEALGRAGITVPPAEAAAPPEEPAPPPAEGRPARARKTAGGVAAPDPVVKPFAPAPWPTRAGRADDPDRALSGLTVDERRVHRILLDALEREAGRGGAGELSYLERKRLGALDLAFINAQLAKMDRGWTPGGAVTQQALLGMVAVAGIVGATLVEGGTEKVLALAMGAALAVAVLLAGALAQAARSSSNPRRQIYEALRELALLVDDAPVSDALDRADQLIDHFAESAAPPRTAAPPRRVRT